MCLTLCWGWCWQEDGGLQVERVGRAEQGTKVGKETPGCTSLPPSSSSSSSSSPQAGPVVPPCGQAKTDHGLAPRNLSRRSATAQVRCACRLLCAMCARTIRWSTAWSQCAWTTRWSNWARWCPSCARWPWCSCSPWPGAWRGTTSRWWRREPWWWRSKMSTNLTTVRHSLTLWRWDFLLQTCANIVDPSPKHRDWIGQPF